MDRSGARELKGGQRRGSVLAGAPSGGGFLEIQSQTGAQKDRTGAGASSRQYLGSGSSRPARAAPRP